jgi:hypothetical protein
MHIYEYSNPALASEIADQIASDLAEESVLLVQGRHFVPEEDRLPLEISKKMNKGDVKVGYEILPVSFTNATREEKERFFDYLDNPNSNFPFYSGAFREILNLPENVKVHGLRPLPYKESKGLIEDFNHCLYYYTELAKQGVDLDEIYTRQILKKGLDIAVFGAIHIEPVKEKVGCVKSCMKIVQEPAEGNRYLQLITPDIIVKATI